MVMDGNNLSICEREEFEEFSKRWRPQVEKHGADVLIARKGATPKSERFLRLIERDIEDEMKMERAVMDGYKSAMAKRNRMM